MASMRPLPIIVFGIGIWAAMIVPAMVNYYFGIGRPITVPELEFGVEVSAFSAVAAACGYAFVPRTTALRAVCAVPVAVMLLYVVPSRLAIWLSESFRSVSVNWVAMALIFALVGGAAGWLVTRYFNWRAGHA